MFVSYAQNLEDVMLWRALGHIPKGFYVDVGAQDPVTDSVSKAFYDHGWRGLHVEPVSEYADRLRQARPDELVVEKCLGAKCGRQTFHVIRGAGAGLSTLVKENAKRAVADFGFDSQEFGVEVSTLDDVLQPHAGRAVHWMKIDVEGAEDDVIKGWNSNRDRPWVLTIEATLPTTQIESHASWEPMVLGAGYSFAYFDGLSRFYVANEHSELMAAFRTPPNIFDNYVTLPLVHEREENARLRHELARLHEALKPQPPVEVLVEPVASFEIEHMDRLKAELGDALARIRYLQSKLDRRSVSKRLGIRNPFRPAAK